jgi:hypothetical protein
MGTMSIAAPMTLMIPSTREAMAKPGVFAGAEDCVSGSVGGVFMADR